jgi:hypothetical protein
MKIFTWRFVIPFYLIFTASPGNTQNLSHLIPAAHYTLINTTGDALGLQDTIQLVNSPFMGDQGVYCNGNYLNHGPDSSLVMTPFIAALFDSVFALRLEFKIADLLEFWRPVFVCGNSYRYLGLTIGPDSTFYSLLNNNFSFLIEDIRVMPDHWYEVTMIHHTPDSLTEFYIDGVKVHELHVPIVRNMQDGEISNTNFASGKTFKGFLRNLRIYGSEGTSAVDNYGSTIPELKVYPNPSNSILQFEYSDNKPTEWCIMNANGIELQSGRVQEGLNKVNMTNQVPGIYSILIRDAKGFPLQIEKFIKTF